MARNKQPLPVWEAVPIPGYGAPGNAIAKPEGLVVFVAGPVPGHVSDLRITTTKSTWADGTAVRIV